MSDHKVIQTETGKVLCVGDVYIPEKFFFIGVTPHSFKPTLYALPGGGAADKNLAIKVARGLA